MINCFKDPIHVLMSVLLSTNDDEEAVGHMNDVREEPKEEDIVDAKEDQGKIVGDTLTLRSSLRKVDSYSTEAEKKKKVQWVDVMGIKDLAEIREFEPSEEDDIDSDRDKNCACVIL